MDIAAAAAVVSIPIAAVSAWYASRQADRAKKANDRADKANEIAEAARDEARRANEIANEANTIAQRAFDIEKERRSDELAPRLVPEIERVTDSHLLLWLRLDSGRPITRCSAFIDTEAIKFTHSQEGVDRADPTTADFGPLHPGGKTARRITHASRGKFRILIKAADDTNEWEIPQEVAIPPSRRVIVPRA